MIFIQIIKTKCKLRNANKNSLDSVSEMFKSDFYGLHTCLQRSGNWSFVILHWTGQDVSNPKFLENFNNKMRT